jgi:dTDP-4-amino-4,6-dideoxygalactose transaminase
MAERWRAARAEHFRAYAAGLSQVGEVSVPKLPPEAESAHALFTVRVLDGRREALREHLASRQAGHSDGGLLSTTAASAAGSGSFRLSAGAVSEC